MPKKQRPRRAVLGIAGTGILTSLGGCSTILAENSNGKQQRKLPDPEIANVTAEIQNFRQTRDYSTTYIHVVNNGGLGELKLTIKAKGEAAIYDDGEQVFSLKAGQELQTRFELFTHEGAQELEIRIEATERPDKKYDTRSITQDDKDSIDYSSNN